MARGSQAGMKKPVPSLVAVDDRRPSVFSTVLMLWAAAWAACVPHTNSDENGLRWFLAAEVVLGTGYFETVTVFDLGPWRERISGGPGALFCRENP